MIAARDGRLIAVLGYHKVGAYPGDWWSWFYVPDATFARQLELLRRLGWEPLSWSRFVCGLDDAQDLPERGVLVTFDDGYRSLCREAKTRLREFECPAVVFVATDYVGGLNSFDRDVEPEEPMCEWTDLEQLQRAGFSIQSHTASHPRLSELSEGDRYGELVRSKRALEERLHSEVDGLSYPYGDDGGRPDGLATELAAAGYRAGFLYGGGPVTAPIHDRFRIPRLAMGPDTDLRAELDLSLP